MSELRLGQIVVPCATLGPINPLPQLEVAEIEFQVGPDVPAEIARNAGYGHVRGSLPYLFKDGFDRLRSDRPLKVAILENAALRATFLLEYGGRLWSLIDVPTGRELLDRNPVLQFANLGMRGAWFSGGVEWNVGAAGHCPLTFEPLHASRVDGPGGAPILRMYEWERIRGTPFQIDACLPDGSAVLYVYVRVRNPHDAETPMYWWSNIAVSERDDVRVIAPAESAFRSGGGDHTLARVPFPVQDDVDLSYPTRVSGGSASFFFDLEPTQYPWVAAVDGDGRGLIQCSTGRLLGRKMFAWGTSPGGRWWQDFLSEPGHPYLEMQAGLAKTQAEHVLMPAGASWSWLEAYGALKTDPAAVHGEWPTAQRAVEDALTSLVSFAELDRQHASLDAVADKPPAEILQVGSGWGALERRRRQTVGEPSADSPGLPFGDETLGAEQAPWVELLHDGRLPQADPLTAPPSYVVDHRWRGLVEASPESWLMRLFLGVILFHSGDDAGARSAWSRSLELEPNTWALRNLAILDHIEGDLQQAAERMLAAHRRAPLLRPLTAEAVRALTEAGRPEDALTVIDALPVDDRRWGRMRLLEVYAAAGALDLDRAQRILADGLEVPDFGGHTREDEIWPDVLWYEIHERRIAQDEGVPIDDNLRMRVRREYPVPPMYDHRDHRDPTLLALRVGH